MKKQTILSLVGLLLLIILSCKLIAQQQESYTFCTGSSYSYLLDTAATTTSSYYKRFSTGSTSYSAHFYHDTIYQSSGSSANPGGYTSVKKWAWNGSTVTNVWTYTLSGAHHDICPMPNGNVLVIVDESKTAANMTAVGGSSSTAVKSPTILEIKPTGATTGTIVWQWKLWDHLCQSTNSSVTATYVSNISQHPELFNVNCSTNGGVTSDWFHMNGIDYNPTLDQIVVSTHIKNEVYIIDHSTTTAQAATHAGGNAGKGGDFLYRWGSPENYGCTTDGNGVSINVIHDARWVPATNSVWPNYISVFNNNTNLGNARALLFLPTYSTTVPYTYTYTAGSVVGPTTCVMPTVKGFTVQNMGGCQVLDNGNILITNPNTAFYECRNSATALQSVTVSTVQSDRLKKSDVYGPWLSTNAASSSICANTSTTLNCVVTTAPSITSPTYTYSWTSVPAGFTSTLQNPTITPATAGTYVYTVVVSMTGTSASTSITTTNTASVTVTVTSCGLSAIASASPSTICEGASTQLNSSASGGSGYTYSWSSSPAGFTSSTQNPTVNPSTTTVYTVTVTSGVTTTTSSTTVTVNALPVTPTIAAGGPVTFCTGGNVTLTSSTGTSYLWSTGATTASITPTTTGNYTVQVTDANGCQSSASSATVVTVNTLPATPIISQNVNMLTSTSATLYEWYFNGSIMAGETNQTISPTQDGNYQVIITDANGCTAISANISFSYTGIKENINDESIRVFPNPSTGMIQISGSIIEGNDFELCVYDLCGKIQFQNRNTQNIDLSKLQNGIYYLTITSGNNRINKRITIIK